MNKNPFAMLHPLVNFVYYFAVIGFGMFLMHPVFLGIGILCGFLYSIILNGIRAVRFNLLFLLPMFLVLAVFNPIFNHEGVTILFYFIDNPITYESIIYGIMAAAMLSLTMLWFSCFNATISSDKIIYLFGRTAPTISLVFSMVLRLVPKYKKQLKIISMAQRGLYSTQGVRNKILRGIKTLSVLVTWALEDGIDTANSMRARGYGLPGRTAYFTYRMNKRNKVYLIILVSLIIIVALGIWAGAARAMFFPFIKIAPLKGVAWLIYGAYFLICITPVICTLREEFIWKRLQSNL